MISRRFDGQVVLVTGASRGIGAATAKAFAAEGATVVANYFRSEEAVSNLAEELRSNGRTIEVVRADVRDTDAVKMMVQNIVGRHGRVDVLVNNAGVTKDTLVAAMEDPEWDEIMATNSGGVFKVARAVAKPMMMARQGKIINVSSVAAGKGGRGQANYAASKGAVESFTRALAVELAPRNIAVNAVSPGIIETDMSAFVRDAGKEEALSKILMKRFGTAQEVARVILFLASDDAAYITGAVIPVDGGFKMA